MVVPRYDDGGFAALPDTVARLLGVGEGGVALDGLPARAQHVVLVLLDAFGWRFFTRHGDHPLLRRFDAVVPADHAVPLDDHRARHDAPHRRPGRRARPVRVERLRAVARRAHHADAVLLRGRRRARHAAARGRRAGPACAPRRRRSTSAWRRPASPAHVFGPATFAPSTYDGVLARGARHPSGRRPRRRGWPSWRATLHARRRAGLRVLLLGRGRLHRPPARAVVAAVRAPPPSAASTRSTPGCARCPRGRSSSWPPTMGRSTSTPRRRSTSTRRGRRSSTCWPATAGGARSPPRAPRATSSCTAGPRRSTSVVDGLERLLGERATVHRVADIVAAGWLGTVGERLRARLADVCVLPAAGRDGLVARAPSLRHALPRPPRRALGGRGAARRSPRSWSEPRGARPSSERAPERLLSHPPLNGLTSGL